jgi:hypothetical protein
MTGVWSRDLSINRYESEVDPKRMWFGEVSNFWPYKAIAPRVKESMMHVMPQNGGHLNQVALQWLDRAKARINLYNLHLLELALWGLDKGVPVECPSKDRYAVELQVGHLCGWNPVDVMEWLVDNPNGPEPLEQAQSPLNMLEKADSQESAASALLSHIYSRQRAQIPALR